MSVDTRWCYKCENWVYPAEKQCPVQMLPGGYEGSHYHFHDFDPETDTCCSCEDYKEDQKEQ